MKKITVDSPVMLSPVVTEDLDKVSLLFKHLLEKGIQVVSVECPAPPQVVVMVQGSEVESNVVSAINSFRCPCLTISSDKGNNDWGDPEAKADGVDTHTISLSLRDPSGKVVNVDETWDVRVEGLIPYSPDPVNLVNGAGQVVVGPSSVPGSVRVWFKKRGSTKTRDNIDVFFG